MTSPFISVIVPTKNPGPEFRAMLAALATQQAVGTVEIVIVDSGSTADDLDWIRTHPVRVVEIPPSEFSHSHARNVGARRASGDLLLFSVQDALPPSANWLYQMSQALNGLGVSALSCREEPRPDADLFYRVMSWTHTRFVSPAGCDLVMEAQPNASPVEQRRVAQLSDVACLIRRDVFARFEYRGDYAEDLDLGLRLTAAGLRLGFVTSVYVVHSHHRMPWYHLRRGYVDQRALLRMLPGYPASVVRAGNVARDVQAAYFVVEHLAHRVLPRLPARATWMDLADAVFTTFEAARRGVLPHPVDREPHEYIDQQCLEFLEMLATDSVAEVVQPEYSGALLCAIPGFASLAFEYLQDGPQHIDSFVMHDFKSLLYKAWAFQSGVVLAGSPSRGNGAPPGLAAVHELAGRDI